MPRLLPASLLASLCLLAACAAPTPVWTAADDAPEPAPGDAPELGPGDTCAETYVIVYDNPRTNFSLGSTNYQNEDFCGAYPYLTWLVANDPLYTGEDPDDRNYLRLASTYEFFASKVDSTNQADRKAYLDSALTMRAEGRAAMDAAGVEYDDTLRDLQEGFFYFQYATEYPDSDRAQFDAFDRALTARPDSLDPWYVDHLFTLSAFVFDAPAGRSDYLLTLAERSPDPAKRAYYASFAEYLVQPPERPDPDDDIRDTAVEVLLAAYDDGSLSGDDVVALLAVALRQPGRLEALGRDPAAFVSSLLNRDEIVDRITNAATLFSLAQRAYGRGDTSRATRLFDRAVENAGSNQQRADFYVWRLQRGHGNERRVVEACLRYDGSNAYCLFVRGRLVGAEARRVAGTTPEGRAAYWCMADLYRNVAAVSTNRQITSAARDAAAGYERAGPTREQYFFATSWRPGQTVTASLGSFGTCSTRVR